MKVGEIADSRGQRRLDALAHAARHHRRSATGADGDDDIAAIDDGGKDESGMHEVVHHIDGKTDGLRARRQRNADIAGAGAEDRDHALQISRERITLRDLDAIGIDAARDHDCRPSHTSARAHRPQPAIAISRVRDRQRRPAGPVRFADRGRQAGTASLFSQLRG